jgi:hypothetical protein
MSSFIVAPVRDMFAADILQLKEISCVFPIEADK